MNPNTLCTRLLEREDAKIYFVTIPVENKNFMNGGQT